MKGQIVELLCGPIASGKSTYCKKRAKEGFIIINDDAIVNAVHCGLYTQYEIALKPLYKGIENFILNMALAMGKSVVIDRPNYSKNMRKRYISIANSLDVPIVCVIFEDAGGAEHAYRRVKSDSRGVDFDYWLNVYYTHKSLYEVPALDEGFEAIINAESNIE